MDSIEDSPRITRIKQNTITRQAHWRVTKFACETVYDDDFDSNIIFGSKYGGLRALHARASRPNLTKTSKRHTS
jgi:hypothetical protein